MLPQHTGHSHLHFLHTSKVDFGSGRATPSTLSVLCDGTKMGFTSNPLDSGQLTKSNILHIQSKWRACSPSSMQHSTTLYCFFCTHTMPRHRSSHTGHFRANTRVQQWLDRRRLESGRQYQYTPSLAGLVGFKNWAFIYPHNAYFSIDTVCAAHTGPWPISLQSSAFSRDLVILFYRYSSFLTLLKVVNHCKIMIYQRTHDKIEN